MPPQGGRKHPQQELIQIDTTNILFICGGAFVGLEKIIADRIGKKGVGFGADAHGRVQEQARASCFARCCRRTCNKFGMIPEFVGRMPVVTHVERADRGRPGRASSTEPKNALVKQYERLFELEDVELEFTDEALRADRRARP